MRRKAIRRKPRERRSPEVQALWDLAWAEFYAPVQARGAQCAVCGSTERWKLQGHHVISQQELKRYARSMGFTDDQLRVLLTDGRNRLIVCEYPCHTLHERALRRISRDVLEPQHFEFAESIDHTWYIERNYPSLATANNEGR